MVYKDIQDIHSSMEREEHMKKYFTKIVISTETFISFQRKLNKLFTIFIYCFNIKNTFYCKNHILRLHCEIF